MLNANEAKLLIRLEERQQNILKRLDSLEIQYKEVSKLMNRGAGGLAVLIAAGALIGWITSSGFGLWHSLTK